MAPRLDSIDEDTRRNDCFLDAMSARVADPLTSVISAGEPLRPQEAIEIFTGFLHGIQHFVPVPW